MFRTPQIDPSLASAMLGLQQGGAGGAAVALALVTYTLQPWREPEGRALERALATAKRFNVSSDLARFVPAAPGRFASRGRWQAFRGVLVALKQLDALEGDARTSAIEQLLAVLGARQD